MKRTIGLGVLLALTTFSTYLATASTETFRYSGPLGTVPYTYGDGAAVYPNGGYGGFYASFGTLTETLYYDPVAQTFREVGSVTVAPSGGSFNIYAGDGGGIPPSPQIIGSASLTIGNNGIWSFDRTYSFAPGSYLAHTAGADIIMPVTGTVTYEGKTYNGSWGYDLGYMIPSITPEGGLACGGVLLR